MPNVIIPKPLKAFAVIEPNEYQGSIIFARHSATARRRGAAEYNDGLLGGLSCRRAPWADQFAETGKIPASIMIENNWHFECHGCNETINENFLEDNNLQASHVIGFQTGPVFCCAKCEDRHNATQLDRRLNEDAFKKLLSDYILDKLPDAELLEKDPNFPNRRGPHIYCTGQIGAWMLEQAIIPFNFAGMKIGHAELRLERTYNQIEPTEPQFFCCHGDQDAFEAFTINQRAKRGDSSNTKPTTTL